jgi:alpha-methylacyl-CoA racemase
MIRPLTGIRVLEFEGIGPGPLAGRMLAEMGATVTVIARPEPGVMAQKLGFAGDSPLRRDKTAVFLDLKQSGSIEQAMSLVESADALIEGYRPGVMERLGLGPIDCAKRNPRLVYGRMTGWGQDGPLSQVAGHDLNYVALSGVLSLSAHRGEHPMVPPTVGDACGALGLAFGIACALLRVGRDGSGCIVDGAIVDVMAMLSGLALMMRNHGQLDGDQPSLFHDSPFYEVYACADGLFITIGAIEPKFYALLLHKLGFADIDPDEQYNSSEWPTLKTRFRALFASQPRSHWCALLEGSDACFAPVLSISEAVNHPHNMARGTYRTASNGHVDAAVAPRFYPLH